MWHSSGIKKLSDACVVHSLGAAKQKRRQQASTSFGGRPGGFGIQLLHGMTDREFKGGGAISTRIPWGRRFAPNTTDRLEGAGMARQLSFRNGACGAQSGVGMLSVRCAYLPDAFGRLLHKNALNQQRGAFRMETELQSLSPVMNTRRRFHPVWLLLMPLLLCAGCGGFSATKSISPLDFLLPGLHMRVDPQQPMIPQGTNTLLCRNISSGPGTDVP